MIVDGAYLPANAPRSRIRPERPDCTRPGLPVVAIVGAQEATVEEAVTAVDGPALELTASKADRSPSSSTVQSPPCARTREVRQAASKPARLRGRPRFPS